MCQILNDFNYQTKNSKSNYDQLSLIMNLLRIVGSYYLHEKYRQD